MNSVNNKFLSLISKIKTKLIGEKIYSSFADANENCSKKGYENRDIIELVIAKAKSYRKSTNSKNHAVKTGVIVLLELTRRISQKNKNIVIFDFGGADGIYYLQLRKLIPDDVKLLWLVIEISPCRPAAGYISYKWNFAIHAGAT